MPASCIGVATEVRQDIADGIYLFYNLIDGGKAASTAELFTESAKLTFGPGSPKAGTIEGAAIREAMVAREQQTSAFTRHIVTNISYMAAGEGVSVAYLLTLFRSDDETRSSVPAFVADVAETWSKRGDEWKLAERIISPAFSRG